MSAHAQRTFRLRNAEFPPGTTAVMAIVNRTTDSFYDGGATYEFDAALAAVSRAVAEGADVVDIGGVRAGPGPEVTVAEEIDRIEPLVRAVRAAHPDLPLSVDTWRAPVARAAVAAGADLINDTWAGTDPDLAVVAAESGAGIVCSHTGGMTPRTIAGKVHYDDVVAEVIADVLRLAERAVAVGVRADGVLIDPTHDFGKATVHSLELTRRLDELTATGWPVLVALSRKDFVGETLDVPVDERLAGTLAATAVSVWHGARVVRAHDVTATRHVVDMIASIRGDRPPKAPLRSV